MKKAILLVSYGVTNQAAWEKTIGMLESEIRKQWMEWDIYQAFTGRRIIEKWKEQSFEMLNETEALESLTQKAYERIVVLPTHLTAGKEYDRVLKAVDRIKEEQVEIQVGRPLLESEIMRKRVANVLIKELALQENEEVVYLGHGTEPNGNEVYELLEEELRRGGQTSAVVGTLGNIDLLLKTIQRKRIRLIPLLLTAGKHVLRDISGKEAGSAAERLREAGFEVTALENGLGEYESIRKVYMQQLDELINC